MTEEVVGLHKRIIANSTTYLKIEIFFFSVRKLVHLVNLIEKSYIPTEVELG